MQAYRLEGAEFGVNTATVNNQTNPRIATFADGRFVVTWVTSDSAQDGDGQALKAQLFAADGTKLGGEFLVNSQAAGSQFGQEVAVLANGTFVVSWTANGTIH